MRPKALFVLHVPPPINGAALVGKTVKESKKINDSIEADYVNLTTSFSLGAIGKGGLVKLLTVVKINLKLLILLSTKKYSVCYMTLTACGLGFYKDFFTVVLLKLFRSNIVYHFHNKGIKKNSGSLFNRLLYRYVFRNTRSILISKQLYGDVADYVDFSNVYVCPNGIVDSVEVNNNSEADFDTKVPFRFLFLSNMMIDKGVLVLLEACSYLKENTDECFECHFVGAWSEISEKDFLKEVREKQLENIVFGHGPKYDDEKIPFFKESNVFVFPTLNEVFGLVNLEAMRHGLPIIGSDEGGISDIIIDGETGFLIDKNDFLSLARKMKYLLGHPKSAKKMGHAGRKRFEEQFTNEIFEKRMAIILEDVISRKSQ